MENSGREQLRGAGTNIRKNLRVLPILGRNSHYFAVLFPRLCEEQNLPHNERARYKMKLQMRPIQTKE